MSSFEEQSRQTIENIKNYFHTHPSFRSALKQCDKLASIIDLHEEKIEELTQTQSKNFSSKVLVLAKEIIEILIDVIPISDIGEGDIREAVTTISSLLNKSRKLYSRFKGNQNIILKFFDSQMAINGCSALLMSKYHKTPSDERTCETSAFRELHKSFWDSVDSGRYCQIPNLKISDEYRSLSETIGRKRGRMYDEKHGNCITCNENLTPNSDFAILEDCDHFMCILCAFRGSSKDG